MPLLIQPSFAKGELAPELHGRVDTSAYFIGLKTARNVIIHPYGGASNRAGSDYLGPVKDHTYAPRLVNFEFKTTDDYVLEFGSLYMRVVRNDEYVTEDPLDIEDISQADPCVITITGHGLSSAKEIFVDEIEGMTRLNRRRFNITVLDPDTFSLQDQVTGDNIDSSALAAYVSGGTVAAIYEIVTPYLTADLSTLKWVQSADVMTLTQNSYPVQELSRMDHDDWTIGEPTFAPTQAFPTGLTIAVNTTGSETERYQVTATNTETGEESLPALNNTTKAISAITKANPAVVTAVGHGFTNGSEVHVAGIVGMIELNDRRFIAANVTTDTLELQGENSTSYTTYVSGGTLNETFVKITNGNVTRDNTVSFTAAANANKYSVYREENGVFSWIGDTQDVTFTDDNIEADTTITPPRSRNPFLGTGNRPGTVSYFEQRRVFGGSQDHPDTSQFSQVGNHKNFSRSDPGQDDDAFAATLNARQVNEIRHYVPGNDLVILTSGSEWRVNSGQDNAFAASSIKQKPQSTWGCCHLAPIVSGNTILFVEENEARIRSLGYSLQIDGYTGTEMSLLARHLVSDNRIVDWAYAHSPDMMAHMVRDDGQALTLTFQSEQEVIAFTHWDTRGSYERVASLRHATNEPEDRVYFVVKRRINGHTVRYLERQHSRRFSDVRDCYFVDCGVSVDDPQAITDIELDDTITIHAAAHGFSNGFFVDLFGIKWTPEFDEFDNESQPDQLNRRRYTVADAATDTFTLKDKNGSYIDGSEFAAYVEGGMARRAVNTVSGLDHLEGEALAALADGNVIKGLVVENGQITLDRRASRIHLGLKFISDLETLDIEAPQGSGTLLGQPVKVNSIVIKFYKSRGLLYGPTFTDLQSFKQRKFEAMGDPTELLTGNTDPLTLPADWKSNGRVCLRQTNPLPMTVLAVIPDITVGGTARDE